MAWLAAASKAKGSHHGEGRRRCSGASGGTHRPPQRLAGTVIAPCQPLPRLQPAPSSRPPHLALQRLADGLDALAVDLAVALADAARAGRGGGGKKGGGGEGRGEQGHAQSASTSERPDGSNSHARVSVGHCGPACWLRSLQPGGGGAGNDPRELVPPTCGTRRAKTLPAQSRTGGWRVGGGGGGVHAVLVRQLPRALVAKTRRPGAPASCRASLCCTATPAPLAASRARAVAQVSCRPPPPFPAVPTSASSMNCGGWRVQRAAVSDHKYAPPARAKTWHFASLCPRPPPAPARTPPARAP